MAAADWSRFRPRRVREWLALAAVAAALIAAGGALAVAAGIGRSHTPWQQRLDASCLAGYGLMLQAAKQPLQTERLDAEARAESDWVQALSNTGDVSSEASVNVDTYVHAKRLVLRIRTQIARSGSPTRAQSRSLAYAQRYAQVLAGQLGLDVCGHEDAALE